MKYDGEPEPNNSGPALFFLNLSVIVITIGVAIALVKLGERGCL